MRVNVIAAFKDVPNNPHPDIELFMADAQARYVADAYNSLSIGA